jgi:micrococcal nuclease
MSRRAASLWVLLFLLLALVGGGTGLLRSDDSRRSGGPVALASSGRVVHIVDGDTVDVRIGDAARRVRYIGVDTPESVKPDTPVQCFAKQASAFNSRLVAGRRVRLQYGPDRHDRYGRLLAYVYLPGHSRSVNAELVAEGYGRVLAIAPNTAHLRPYLRLERLARERHLGLWGSCDYRPLDF